MGPSRGLGDSDVAVDLQRGVVVDVTVGPDDAAMAVRRVLVDAEVGHEHHVVTKFCPQVAQRQLYDPVRIGSARAGCVLVSGHAEEHDRLHAHVCQFDYPAAKRLSSVLVHARERCDFDPLVNAFAHEQGCHEVVDRDVGFGHEVTQRCRSAQTTKSMHALLNRRS